MTHDDALKQINRAKFNLFTKRNTTFFSSLLANLKLEITENVPTAAVDGISLFISPVFLEKLSLDETIGLLLHEVMHIVYDHLDRAKTEHLNFQIWNVAADYLINGEILELGYRLPAGRLHDPKYAGMGTREIYDLLIQDPDMAPKAPMDDLIVGTPQGMDANQHREAVITNVVKAVTQAQLSGDPGSVPAHVTRMVDKLLNPRLPWNAILQNYMSAYNKSDYRWSMPNRRYWPDLYLPSLRGDNLQRLTAVIDVSGSIEQEDLDAFMAEIRYIFETLKPSCLHLLTFDMVIHEDQEFYEGDSPDTLTMHGGGGTSFHHVIQKLLDTRPEVVVVFTDGEFKIPYLQDLQSDVFWIIKNHEDFEFRPSKGEVIRYI